MKKQLIFLFLFSAFITNAQSFFRPASWQIGLHGSQGSMRNLTDRYNPFPQSKFTSEIQSTSTYNYGFSLGAEFIATNWLNLRLQAKYGNQSFRRAIGGLLFGVDHNGMGGPNTDPNSITYNLLTSTIYNLSTFHFVSPSLAVMLNVPNHSRFYVGASVNSSFHILSTVKSKTVFGKGDIEQGRMHIVGKEVHFTPTYLQAFVGYRQPLSNNFMISLEPFIEYSTKLSTLDSNGSTAKFSNIGVSLYVAKNRKTVGDAIGYHF